MAEPKVERNPEATGPIKRGHVRILEHMLNYRLGRVARMRDKPNHYMLSEIGALHAAIATLNEILDERDASP